MIAINVDFLSKKLRNLTSQAGVLDFCRGHIGTLALVVRFLRFLMTFVAAMLVLFGLAISSAVFNFASGGFRFETPIDKDV